MRGKNYKKKSTILINFFLFYTLFFLLTQKKNIWSKKRNSNFCSLVGYLFKELQHMWPVAYLQLVLWFFSDLGWPLQINPSHQFSDTFSDILTAFLSLSLSLSLSLLYLLILFLLFLFLSLSLQKTLFIHLKTSKILIGPHGPYHVFSLQILLRLTDTCLFYYYLSPLIQPPKNFSPFRTFSFGVFFFLFLHHSICQWVVRGRALPPPPPPPCLGNWNVSCKMNCCTTRHLQISPNTNMQQCLTFIPDSV